MIDMIIKVTNYSCSRCGTKDVPLFTLKLRPGELPTLTPNGPLTHSGACRACWLNLGREIIHQAVLIQLTLGDV